MAAAASGTKRKAAELADIHDDVLERVLARLPPSTYSQLRRVCRRWHQAAESPTFLAACAALPGRDPWFLMLSDDRQPRPAMAFDAGEGVWAPCRGATGIGNPLLPVAAAQGLVLYRADDDDDTACALTVVNPLTGASRALPPPPSPAPGALHAVAMYGSFSPAVWVDEEGNRRIRSSDPSYRVVLIHGEVPDLSMAVFDSSLDAWEDVAPLSRKKKPEETSSADDEDEDGDSVYFLSKSGDVMASSFSTLQRSASRQYSCAVVACQSGVEKKVYFLSQSGAVVACDMTRRVFVELPRILPACCEYSIDVVACGDRVYVVVLSEFLDTASLRVWEHADDDGAAWRQVAAMPPAMSHPFYGKKADVNCVGHGSRVMVCVSSGGGCFMCDVGSNRWEELLLPPCSDFVAALSFEPRMEVAV